MGNNYDDIFNHSSNGRMKETSKQFLKPATFSVKDIFTIIGAIITLFITFGKLTEWKVNINNSFEKVNSNILLIQKQFEELKNAEEKKQTKLENQLKENTDDILELKIKSGIKSHSYKKQ